jgi:hypothetical protein
MTCKVPTAAQGCGRQLPLVACTFLDGSQTSARRPDWLRLSWEWLDGTTAAAWAATQALKALHSTGASRILHLFKIFML